jgi:hypothetical protein
LSTEIPEGQENEDVVTDGEARADDLSDELAKKYDPERLLKLVSKRAGRGQQLDASIRGRYERRFGVDLGHVRVYTGEFAEEFNKQRNAYAVTIGGTGMILMGGSPDRSMTGAAGRALLAHELTHVAQAKKGLYRSARSESMPFAEDAEDEAHEMEALVASEESGYGDATDPSPATHTDQSADNEARALDTINKVRERVYELLADTMRQQDMRAGVDPRRP